MMVVMVVMTFARVMSAEQTYLAILSWTNASSSSAFCSVTKSALLNLQGPTLYYMSRLDQE